MRITKLEQSNYSKQYNKIQRQNNTFKGILDEKFVKGDNYDINKMRRSYNIICITLSSIIFGLLVILFRK